MVNEQVNIYKDKIIGTRCEGAYDIIIMLSCYVPWMGGVNGSSNESLN